MAIALIAYLGIAIASLISSFFGVGDGWGFYGVGGLGILLCVAGVALAAFSLALDFDAIETAVKAGCSGARVVALRIRPHRHVDLAVPRVAALARDPQQRLVRRVRLTDKSKAVVPVHTGGGLRVCGADYRTRRAARTLSNSCTTAVA